MVVGGCGWGVEGGRVCTNRADGLISKRALRWIHRPDGPDLLAHQLDECVEDTSPHTQSPKRDVSSTHHTSVD